MITLAELPYHDYQIVAGQVAGLSTRSHARAAGRWRTWRRRTRGGGTYSVRRKTRNGRALADRDRARRRPHYLGRITPHRRTRTTRGKRRGSRARRRGSRTKRQWHHLTGVWSRHVCAYWRGNQNRGHHEQHDSKTHQRSHCVALLKSFDGRMPSRKSMTEKLLWG